MNFIETIANEMNCSSITLKVEQNNPNSIKTFKKWRFRITESITRDIGKGFRLSGHIMIKSTG